MSIIYPQKPFFLLTQMANKNTKNFGSRITDSLEAPVETMDCIATNLLDSRDSHHIDMKVEKLEKVKLLF